MKQWAKAELITESLKNTCADYCEVYPSSRNCPHAIGDGVGNQYLKICDNYDCKFAGKKRCNALVTGTVSGEGITGSNS